MIIRPRQLGSGASAEVGSGDHDPWSQRSSYGPRLGRGGYRLATTGGTCAARPVAHARSTSTSPGSSSGADQQHPVLVHVDRDRQRQAQQRGHHPLIEQRDRRSRIDRTHLEPLLEGIELEMHDLAGHRLLRRIGLASREDRDRRHRERQGHDATRHRPARLIGARLHPEVEDPDRVVCAGVPHHVLEAVRGAPPEHAERQQRRVGERIEDGAREAGIGAELEQRALSRGSRSRTHAPRRRPPRRSRRPRRTNPYGRRRRPAFAA